MPCNLLHYFFVINSTCSHQNCFSEILWLYFNIIGSEPVDVKEVRALLQQYNLMKVEENPSLISCMETDQSESTALLKSNQSDSLKHVDLWPLSDHIVVLSEMRLVNKMMALSDKCNTEEVGALVDFGAQFTPLSPSALNSLKQLNEDKTKVS